MTDKDKKLDQIEVNILSCQKCRLYKQAKKGVPGEGNRNAEIMFIGEAPGAVEDETGRPFVGRAGKLLEVSLREIGLERSEVWIGNIIKHRPPGNRDPLPDEIKACIPYLHMQIELISPKLMVTLGRFAMNFFYKDGKISRDKGRLIRGPKYHIYPVYHPAAALRSSNMMAAFREDFSRIPKVLEEIKKGRLSSSSFDEIKPEGIPDGQLGLGV